MNENRETLDLEQEELDFIKYETVIKSSFASNGMGAMVALDLNQAKEIFKNAMEIYNNFDKTLEEAIKFGKENGMDKRYKELNKDFSEYSKEEILEKKREFIENTISNLGICDENIPQEIKLIMNNLNGIKNLIISEQEKQQELSLQSKSGLRI